MLKEGKARMQFYRGGGGGKQERKEERGNVLYIMKYVIAIPLPVFRV